MNEELLVGNQNANKPHEDQGKQTPSALKHRARPLGDEDLKAILADLEQAGETDKAAFVKKTLEAPQPPAPTPPINQSPFQTSTPRREMLPPVNIYPARQGRQKLENIPLLTKPTKPLGGNQAGK